MRDMDQKSCDGESVETISTCSGLFASGFESPCEGFESFDYGSHDDDAWPDTDDEYLRATAMPPTPRKFGQGLFRLNWPWCGNENIENETSGETAVFCEVFKTNNRNQTWSS